MTDNVSQLPEAAIVESLNQLKAQADALIAKINEQADLAATRSQHIEEGRIYVERTKTELDSRLEATQARYDELETRVDATKATHNSLLQLHADAQTATNSVLENRAQTTATLEAVQLTQGSVAEIASRVDAVLKEITVTAADIATKSEHIEQGRIHADSVRAHLDEALVQAQQSAATTAGQVAPAQASFQAISDVRTSAQEAKTAIDAIADGVTSLRSQCEAHVAVTKRLAESTDSLESSIRTSETHLTDLQKTAEERLKQIDSLLLGATNAGLAHAFDHRSKKFKYPEWIWQGVFICSLIFMLALAIWETASTGTAPGYDELARMLLHRLPFFVPLVWLAIHSSRQASLAKRMEEEYAFKATISTSFEGYRRQMAEISKDLSETSPLAQLCNDTLKAISTPPGLVYDRHRMDPTPGTAAAEALKPLADAASALAQKVPSMKTG